MILKLIIAAIYNLTLIAGTVWLIGWHDWSGWWFLLTILFLIKEVPHDE